MVGGSIYLARINMADRTNKVGFLYEGEAKNIANEAGDTTGVKELNGYDESSYPAHAESDEEVGTDSDDLLRSTTYFGSKYYDSKDQFNLKGVDETLADILCTVCSEVLVDPCTLHCGHSFCQLCLAAMWKNSSVKSPFDLCCPVCRQPWGNFPGVNIQLRFSMEHFTVVLYEA